MCSAEAENRALLHQALVVHGRADQVISLSTSLSTLLSTLLTLPQWIARSQLHVYGQCGHWTQIEPPARFARFARFARLVRDFLAEASDAEPTSLNP